MLAVILSQPDNPLAFLSTQWSKAFWKLIFLSLTSVASVKGAKGPKKTNNELAKTTIRESFFMDDLVFLRSVTI
jgi:hypothetical protein